MAKQKEPTPRQLFVERMKREGREEEWRRLLREEMEATGKGFSPAASVVMRKMGYKGPEHERGLHAVWLNEAHKTGMERQRDRLQDEIRQERKITDYEEALRDLPARVNAAAETSWIAGHPAMTRWARMEDKTKAVEITAWDILYAPHGPAPSRSAVAKLTYWANHPGKFFEMQMSEDKKQTDESGGGNTAEDADLAEVERLFKEFFGDKQAANNATSGDPAAAARDEGGRRGESGADGSAGDQDEPHAAPGPAWVVAG